MKTSAKWKLKEARAHFDELLKEAADHRPQSIEVAGGVVVIVARADELARETPHIGELFLSSPLKGVDVDFPRMQAQMRDVELSDE